MSEVLIDFAEPLMVGLSLPEDRGAIVAALNIAGMLWNEAAFPRKGGSGELYAKLSKAMDCPRDPAVEVLFDAVIARGRLLYPDLLRLITSVDVIVDDEGNCTVRVMSSA